MQGRMPALPQNHSYGPSPFDSMFVWNAYLTRDLRALLGNDIWAVPLVHGFFEQRRVSGAMAVGGDGITLLPCAPTEVKQCV